MRSIATVITLTLCVTPLLTGCPAESGNEIPGCGCIEDEDDADPPESSSYPTCGDEICPEVSAACDGYCETPLVVSNPDALTCALIALRDRTPGVVRWTASEYSGQFVDDGYLLIREDGTAVRRNFGLQDLSYIAEDALLGPLKDPGYFDACLAQAEDDARFACLRFGLESQTRVCDEGWMYDVS
jgi:hypothetical protein